MGAASSVQGPQETAGYLEALKEEKFATLSPEAKLALLDKFQKEYVAGLRQPPKDGKADNVTAKPIAETQPATEKAPVADMSSPGQIEDALREIFSSFALYGAGKKGSTAHPDSVEIDGSKFAKLCSNCKLIGKNLTKTDVDMVFTKAKQGSASRKIGFASFQVACQMLAERKGITYDRLVGMIVTSGGAPVNNGTVAGPNRFYDDKSTWGKGVAAHGGPTTNDKRITLSNLADRSAADVRGRKHTDVLNAVVA